MEGWYLPTPCGKNGRPSDCGLVRMLPESRRSHWASVLDIFNPSVNFSSDNLFQVPTFFCLPTCGSFFRLLVSWCLSNLPVSFYTASKCRDLRASNALIEIKNICVFWDFYGTQYLVAGYADYGTSFICFYHLLGSLACCRDEDHTESFDWNFNPRLSSSISCSGQVTKPKQNELGLYHNLNSKVWTRMVYNPQLDHSR